ncbi:MAG: flagellar basal body rod protein FlgC [candidate division Zixibacteria bacterium 4484_95]|nr:MAG: flagellar basal body rod protein FlgC [candidate division Zixibacteria bacterium 4484_95]
MNGIFSIIDMAASGLSAQRKKINAIAQNIANVETTKTPEGTPYKRRQVVFAEDSKKASFIDTFKESVKALSRTHIKHLPNSSAVSGKTSKVPFVSAEEKVIEPVAFKMVYDPTHPDADENGYVEMPDIDIIAEMVEMMVASRAYEANVTVARSAKEMAMDALDI